LDRRRGVGRPDGPSFSLNLAVDLLLKREFDVVRNQGEAHPLMKKHGIDAVPLRHPSLEEWRDAFRGISFFHAASNFQVFGAVDDVWKDAEGRLHIVDYKATSTEAAISLEAGKRESYKRQLEIYQWLFRQNGFDVSPTAYLVFVNADRRRQSFDECLRFTTHILPYEGSDGWIESALQEAKFCLLRDQPPEPHPECEWCGYRKEASKVEWGEW
jgi:RecB family exonuclease